ncbi:MAG: SDR family oxidoreductase [Planctomycetota bacterium]|nr:SDR family oxidoreductase [Planctomycetota bacterium]
MDFHSRYGPWALITGASSGFGAEYARQLAAKGLHLILVARRQDRLETLAQEIQAETDVEVHIIPLDITQVSWLSTLRESVAEREIGLLVNNAGYGKVGHFLAMSPQELAQMIRLNVEAVTLLARDYIPAMKERGRGGMILLASAAGYQPTPWMAAYGATKGYDLLLGEALSTELAASGVDILTVSPGSTKTEFHAIAGAHNSALGVLASVDDVVAQSLRSLGRRISFVHGWQNKLATSMARIFPRSWVSQISGKVLGSRLKQEQS